MVADGATWTDLAVNHIEVVGLYWVCAARHKALRDALQVAP